MVIANDARIAETCARLRHQAYSGQPYVHDAIGYNFRMTEIQAAIGLVQVGRAAEITERGPEPAAYYASHVSKGYARPRAAPGRGHVYPHYTPHAPAPSARHQVPLQPPHTLP